MKNHQRIRQAQHKKGFVSTLIVIIVLIVVVAGAMLLAGFNLFGIKLREKKAEIFPTDIATLTKNWVEYRNEKYNITFKYPSNLVFKLTESGPNTTPNAYIIFQIDTGNHAPVFGVRITNTLKSYNSSGAEYLEHRITSPDVLENYPTGLEETTIGGKKAYLGKVCFSSGACTHQAYVAHGDYYYEPYDAIILDSNINPQTLEGVLSTFRFIK
ncbi:hypothetical protein KW782_01675 [Candidatus Parcubacteria bacterium]|nr:hypothetical protein [Candidatus Parcubacteria bacterium]